MAFTLSEADMARIQLIEQLTRAKIKDVIDEAEDRLVVVAENGQLYKALGKNASNLRLIEKKLNKKVRIVEHTDDPKVFLANLCKPNKIVGITQEEKVFTIEPQDFKSRGYLIGRGASTLRLHENIMRRYFECEEIKITNVESE